MAAPVAPLFGTTVLRTGTTPLWSTCLCLCALAAVGQFALGPAVRRRTGATVTSGPDAPAPADGGTLADPV